MTRNKAPCVDCTRRELGCHGKCEEYRTFREDAQKRHKFLRMGEADIYTSDYAKSRQRRNKRR